MSSPPRGDATVAMYLSCHCICMFELSASCSQRTVSFLYYSQAVARLPCRVTSRSNFRCRYVGLRLLCHRRPSKRVGCLGLIVFHIQSVLRAFSSLAISCLAFSAPHLALLRYDTIRDAILTCARKPIWVGLIYRTETTTKNCKTEKLKSENSLC